MRTKPHQKEMLAPRPHNVRPLTKGAAMFDLTLEHLHLVLDRELAIVVLAAVAISRFAFRWLRPPRRKRE